jgi:hypothetical protein
MREIPVHVMRVPIAGPRGELEVRVVAPAPGRWRLWLALAMVRVAGRLAKLRVRVSGLT